MRVDERKMVIVTTVENIVGHLLEVGLGGERVEGGKYGGNCLTSIAGGNDSEVKSVGFCRRGKHLLFCFYYIIKFEKSQILEAKRSEAGKKGGKGKRSKGKKKTEQNRKIGYGERGGGMAVWRFQILPFPRNHSPL